MSALTFSTEDIPATARVESGPNMFTEIVNELPISANEHSGNARSFVLPGAAVEKDNADVRAHLKLLRAAARERNATARSKLVAVGTDKAPKVKVVFWLTEPIKRPRKADAPAETAPETDEAPMAGVPTADEATTSGSEAA